MDRETIKLIIRFILKDSRFTDMFISRKRMYIDGVEDVVDNTIFRGVKGCEGWLVFIDPCFIANWSHKCHYWFFTENGVIINNKGAWFPKSSIELERI